MLFSAPVMFDNAHHARKFIPHILDYDMMLLLCE